MEQQHPGERRPRRFARPAEEGPRPGSFAPDVTADASAASATPSTAIETPPQTPSADGDEGAAGEIMTRLPRSRPERRSTRRPGAKGQRRKTTTARSAGSRKRAAATKKAATKQPARGLREQITDATIQTATMPFRATFGLARSAGRLIGRLR